MPSFSQRKGLKPLQKVAQIEWIDDDLRNQLWSALHDYVLQYMLETEGWGGPTPNAREALSLGRQFWTDFLKQPSDDMPGLMNQQAMLKEFILSNPWNEVYDGMEFILATLLPRSAGPLASRWNGLLSHENAGYRVLNNLVTDITSETEISEIEQSLASGITAVEEHIEAALTFLSDRKSPNYRNSIKESISAVEAICRLLAGGKTLGDALKLIRDKVDLHPALEKGFSALYGYTSDEGGIRHALLKKSAPDRTDARFMLVACSAFVNFVVSKAADRGLKLS